MTVRKGSLNGRLTVVVTTFMVLVALVAALVYAKVEQRSLQQSMGFYLDSMADTAGVHSAASLMFDDADTARRTLQTLAITQNVIAAALYRHDGSLFADYRQPRGKPAQIPDYAPGAAVESANGVLKTFRDIRVDGELVGHILVAVDFEALASHLTGGTSLAVWIVPAAVLVALFMAALLKRAISTPVLELAQMARQVSYDKDYSLRVEKARNDEIGELGECLNAMLDTIATRDERLLAANQELETVNAELVAAREQALEAAEAKGRFLATMSHEIRTPMNGVMGLLDLLAGTHLSPKQRRYLRTIQRSAEALLGIINDILDFSKLEAGKVEVSTVDFDIRDLIEDLGDAFAGQAHGKGLELCCHVDSAVPSVVHGDEQRIRQVLVNLIGNAIKFTDHGEVAVRVEIDARDADRRLHFEVIDTGIGMTSEVQQRLFKAFTQADASTTRKYGGTGLGLAISRQFVELMGGAISASGASDAGSTFRFTVPLTGVDSTDTEDQPLPDDRILLVDLQARQALALYDQLTSWGASVRQTEINDFADALTSESAGDNAKPITVILDLERLTESRLDPATFAERHPQILSQARMLVLSRQYSDANGMGLRPQFRYALLHKPVRRADLLTALNGATCSEPHRAEDKETTPHPELGARILVAEDNLINQSMVMEMLGTLRCSTRIVENGLAAIDAVADEDFDLILMDCQMPEMDGYTAATAIRERESSGKRRIPIIAVTANAMEGDRQKCLEAGMDDYLAKPFKQHELVRVLRKWVNDHRPSTAADIAPEPADGGDAEQQAAAPVLDQQWLENIRGLRQEGGPDPLARYIDMFIRNSEVLLDSIRAAVSDRDANALLNAAHSLKSDSGNLGAKALAASCRELENMGRMKEVAGADRVLEELEVRYAEARQALNHELVDK